MSDEATGTTALGPIATRVVYEDDRVRIWDQVIEPGTTTGPHRHELPYALVTVEGSTLEVLPVPGFTPVHGNDPISVSLDDRTAGVIPGGSVEDAHNTGDTTYRAILVEFKHG
jgi:hypothetical protein